MIKVLTRIITRVIIESEAREKEKNIKEEIVMVNLKGSEKQIKWAEDIRREQIADFLRWKEKWIAKWQQEKNQKELTFVEKLSKFIEELDEAEKWIEIKKLGLNFFTLFSPQKREQYMKHFEFIFGKDFLK